MQARTLKTARQDQTGSARLDDSIVLQVAGGLAGWAVLMGYLFLLPGLLGQLIQPLMGA